MEKSNRASSLNFIISREWIFQKVLHCIQSRNSAKTCGLLILGGSGSGKTTICKQISDSSYTPSSTTEIKLREALVASHFCQPYNSDSLNITKFIYNLHKSILNNPTFCDAYKQSLKTSNSIELFEPENILANPDRAFKNGILLPLLSFNPPKQSMFILIDSVDETLLSVNSLRERKFKLVAEDRHRQGSQNISDIISVHHNFFPEWLSVVCSCRNEHSKSLVLKKFTGFRKLQIDDLSKSYVIRDIQFYILSRIDSDGNLKQLINQETEMLNILHIKSNGYILYLEIILDLICDNFLTIQDLRNIPGTLSGLYLWIFESIFESEGEEQLTIVKHIFSLMLATLTPLTEQEIFNAILHYDNSFDFYFIKSVMNRVKYFLLKNSDGCCEFRHPSLADWLADIKLCTPRFKCSLTDGHAILALLHTQQSLRRGRLGYRRDFLLHIVASVPIFQLRGYQYAAWLLYSGQGGSSPSSVPGLQYGLSDWELESVLGDLCTGTTSDPIDPGIAAQRDVESETAEAAYLRFVGAVRSVNKYHSRRKTNANLLSESASIHDAVRRNDYGHTSELLSQAGAGATMANRPSGSGTTALMIAAQKGFCDLCRLLLRHGALIDVLDNDGWTPLRLAIWNGHKGVVETLLQADETCHPDFCGPDDRTALRTAAWVGNLIMTRALLSRGADPKKADSEGRTPLMAATYRANIDIAKLLLRHDANVNHRDNDGRNALFVAVLCLNSNSGNVSIVNGETADSGTLRIIDLLLKNGSNINEPDQDGMVPLSIAAYEGNRGLCELLLEHNADVDFIDRNSRTPLMAATLAGHCDTVRLLLFWGAAVHCLDRAGFSVLSVCAAQGSVTVLQELLARGLDETHRDNRGLTPLHIAAQEGHLDAVRTLLEAGARPNETDDVGRIPLMLACQEGHFEVALALLGAWEDSLHFKAFDGSTALKIAILNDWPDIVSLLLDHGPNLFLQDNSGRSVLHVSAMQDQCEWFADLLEVCKVVGNKVIDLPDDDGRTALHLAAWKGDAEMVYALIKACADVAVRDAEGRTALHLAAWQGHYSVCQVLIRCRAEIDVSCSQGATPLCIAAQEGHLDICDLLIKTGANIYHADDFNRTPYKVAFKGSHMKICKLLEKNGALLFMKN